MISFPHFLRLKIKGIFMSLLQNYKKEYSMNYCSRSYGRGDKTLERLGLGPLGVDGAGPGQRLSELLVGLRTYL